MRQTISRIVTRLPALLLTCSLWSSAAQADIEITDITGRHITLQASANHVVLGDARHVMVLGMLMDDPISRIVGWRQDKSLDAARFAAFEAAFPDINEIAPVGAGNRQLSVEKVIALQPDVVILSLLDANDPKSDVPLMQLDAAGIKVVFVDFFSHPIENTPKSLQILGQIFNSEDAAADLMEYYSTHLETVLSRLEAATPVKPSAFMQVHASPQKCCATIGSGVFHDFITAAGGHNLGKDLVPGIMGNVGLENLIAADPDFFLATGGTHMRARGGVVIGAGVAQTEVDETFDTLISAPGIADLRAVQDGNAIAIWHLFNDSPMHVALIEYLAKRFHPTLFEDIDPQATVREMQTRFSPITVDGVWWSGAQ
jgi:iron complex transport system substrate-binding protein